MDVISQVQARQNALERVAEAARVVVLNAYGTTPRHTKARGGGCREDCIPCGLADLNRALDDLRSVGGEVTDGPE